MLPIPRVIKGTASRIKDYSSAFYDYSHGCLIDCKLGVKVKVLIDDACQRRESLLECSFKGEGGNVEDVN